MKRSISVRNLFIFIALVFISLVLSSCVTRKQKKLQALNNKPLLETCWYLKSVKGEAVPKSPMKPYLIFENSGTFGGKLGCNRCTGTFFAKKNKMKIEYSGSTKRLCTDMKTEKMFMSALQSQINHFEISNDTLRLSNKDGEVMLFVAGENPVQVTEQQ